MGMASKSLLKKFSMALVCLFTALANAQVIDLGPHRVTYLLEDVDGPDDPICNESGEPEGTTDIETFNIAVDTVSQQVIFDGDVLSSSAFVARPASGASLVSVDGVNYLVFFKVSVSDSSFEEVVPGISQTTQETSNYNWISRKPDRPLTGTQILIDTYTITDEFGQYDVVCTQRWSVSGYALSSPPLPPQDESVATQIKKLIFPKVRNLEVKPTGSTGALKVKSRKNTALGVRG